MDTIHHHEHLQDPSHLANSSFPAPPDPEPTLDNTSAHYHPSHEQYFGEEEQSQAVQQQQHEQQQQQEQQHGDDDSLGSTSVLLTRPTLLPPRPHDAPCPEQLAFGSKAEFKQWLHVESQWCHFVQRRTTTPEKRAIERMKAREKAHEQHLASMPPEEAAAVAPLKKRKRQRTSPVIEKITYACHHSGTYTSRHSATLPAAKLRMNTKKSVKCDCQAKIIASEMDTGEMRVAYHWRHTGHAPGSMEDLQRSRLPPDVDAWLVRQIEAGKDTEEIRKLLEMSPADKEEYLRTVAQLPAAEQTDETGEATGHNTISAADLPPTIALNLRIKYPDIYNRYRKLKGPIKATKVKKTPQSRKRTGTSRDAVTEDNGDYHAPPEVVGIGFPLELRPDQEHALDTDALQGYDPTSHVELAMALSARRNEQMIDPLLMDAVDAVMGETALGLDSAEGAQNAWDAMRIAGMGQDGQQDGGNPF